MGFSLKVLQPKKVKLKKKNIWGWERDKQDIRKILTTFEAG